MAFLPVKPHHQTTGMKFDNILVEVGVFGRYQIVLCLLIALTGIPSAWHAIGQVFLAAKTDHWCAVPESQSLNCSSLESDCLELQKELTLPSTVDEDGNTVYSECERYLNARSSPEQGVSNLTDGQDDGWTNETIECDAGWEYDRSQYKTTIIQDVMYTHHFSFLSTIFGIIGQFSVSCHGLVTYFDEKEYLILKS